MFAARESYGCADGTSSVVARGASRAARRRSSTGIVPGRVPGHRSGGRASRVVAVDPSKLEGTPNKRGIVPGMGPGAREWRRIHKELKTKYKMRTVGSAECAQMMRQNAVLLDVRFEPDFEQWSVPGSVSCPYVDDGLARLGVGHRGARGRGEMCGDVSGGRRVNARDECQMNESNE